MFGMSVKLVPGWLVAMAPSAIGVPVALTPGLLPHCEVSTVAAPAALLDVDPAGVVAPVLVVPVPVLLFEMLLQPAAAPAPIRVRAAARTAAPCALLALRIFMSSPSGRWRLSLSAGSHSVHIQFTFTTILTASGGLLIANSNASAARASGKWCEKSLLMFSRAPVTRLMASRKSAAVAVLEPRTSISFSGKIPGRIGAVSERSE